MRVRASISVLAGIALSLGGCGTDSSGGDGSTGGAATEPNDDDGDEASSSSPGTSSSATTTGAGTDSDADTQAPDDTGLDTGDDSTTAAPDGPLDCDALCDPYETCDESVYLTCRQNCGYTVPPLVALDDACGDAATAYFGCAFTLSCDDAIADLRTEGPAPECADALDAYIAACTSIMPAACEGYCATVLACADARDDPAAQQACAFECVLFHGFVALAELRACDAAAPAYFDCIASNTCEAIGGGACDEAGAAFEAECGPFAR